MASDSLFQSRNDGSMGTTGRFTKSLILSTLASNYFRKISGVEFRSFFKEVQCILNWRPLTPVSSDIHEYHTISPMSIMHMGVVPPTPLGHFMKAESPSKSWKTCQLLAQEFWQSWICFYLPDLIPCPKWNKVIKKFKVGGPYFTHIYQSW